MTRAAVLFHIPHSSIYFPFRDGYLRPDLVDAEVKKLTDWKTESIFAVEGVVRLVAEFSRVFCDVERFVPDESEPMASKGMGFYYTHTDDGRVFRQEGEWKERVLREFYEPHHRRFEELVNGALETEGSCLIMDCHSFSDMPFLRDPDQSQERPDDCIGTQGMHTPRWMRETAEQVCSRSGFSVRFDSPYAGSIVPLRFFNRDPRVMSIMIELNRKLYLEGSTADPSRVLSLRGMVEELTDALVKNAGHFLKAAAL